MTGSRSADGFAPRRQERLAAGFQGAIAMDIEVQGRAMEPQVLGHLRDLGGAIGERGPLYFRALQRSRRIDGVASYRPSSCRRKTQRASGDGWLHPYG
jgi:hypothetical protein